MIDSLLLSLVE